MMKKIVTLGMTFLMLISCKEAKPQTRAEKKQAEKNLNQENLKQFVLGVSKICINEDYEKHFGTYRDITKRSSREGNCCTHFIPEPFINPYEYYLYLFEEEQSIIDNRRNPFGLKKIRSQLKKRTDKVKEKVQAIDEQNLVYKGNRAYGISEYDFDKEHLNIRGGVPSSFYFKTHLRFNFEPARNSNRNNKPLSLPLSPKRAEKLFEYYTDKGLVHYKPLNAYFTYGVQMPSNNNSTSQPEIVIKKIEFFHPNGWDEKIGELTF